MKKLKRLTALILTAALITAGLPAMAQTETAADTASVSVAEETVEATALPTSSPEIEATASPTEEVTEEPIAEISEEIEDVQYGEEESMYPYVENPVPEGEYIPDTYGYPIQGDPYNTKKVKQGVEYSSGNKKLNDAFWLRDTDFFGVWDSENEKWTTEPKLDYEQYPDLEKVEEAAKAANYEQAKLAYYNYYVEKEKTMTRPKDTSDALTARITCDLLCKNFMYNALSGITPVSLMNIGNEKAYRSADVASTVTSYLGTRTYLAFWVIATDKNGDWAEFDSKEGENKPYLKIRVDGAEKIIYACEDTNIKAGANKSTVYGTQDVLTAREDGGADGVLVNDNTSRIYLKFDVSDLRAGDTIQAATLNLYGSNMVEGQEKEVVIFYSDDSSWTETKATYSNVTAQVVFSYDQMTSWPWNQPSGAGSRYQEELLRFNTWVDKLVKVYNYTGDEKYAYTAIRQFMDYINVRGDDPCWLKSLDVAVRTQCMPGLWMQLLDSQYMSPEIFTGFMKWCYVQGNCSRYFTRTGNWGTSETLGLYTLVINYPEFKDSSAWLDRVRARYESLSNSIVKDDYTCYELSHGYTDYTLTHFLDAKTTAENLGIDFRDYSPYSQRTLDNIEHLGLFMYWTTLPGVSDNQVGDGYSHRGNFKSRLESLGEWFQNEQLMYGATGGEKGKQPEFTSKMFPTGKKAVMRSDWTEKAVYFYTDVDGGVGNHAHPDDNSIVVAAHGQYLLVDPLYGSYSSSSATAWLKSSIGHNQVVMNGKNQTYNSSSAVGSIPRWETNNNYDFVTTSAKAVQDASEYRRSTFFYRDKLFLVNDYLVPNSSNATKSNKYVQAWHYLPEANITMDDTTNIVKTNFLGPNIQVIPVGNDEFDRAATVDGYYSEGQGSLLNAKYTEYEKNGVGVMTFNTILLPEETGEDYDVSTGELQIEGLDETEASAIEFYLTSKVTGEMTRYVYYLLHDESKKASVKIDNFTTDASMLFVEMDYKGNIKYFAVQDATTLSQGNKTIFDSDSEVKEFSAKWSGNYAFVDSSTVTAKALASANAKLTTAGNDVGEIKVNGETVDATVYGEEIYFGTAPTLSPDATPTPTPSATKAPAVHGGGSGGGGGGGGSFVPPVTAVTPKPQATAAPEDTMNESLKAELENHWANTEVNALYEKGIVNGQTDTSFGLENPITRAEFITLMVRALGLEIVEYSGSFADVKADDWYANNLETAYQNGIFEGSGNNADPNSNITREQMAKMLSAVIDNADGESMTFADEAQISDWAKEGVDKVSRAGLMQGRSENNFDPKANTKRCEAFVVIYRLINK